MLSSRYGITEMCISGNCQLCGKKWIIILLTQSHYTAWFQSKSTVAYICLPWTPKLLVLYTIFSIWRWSSLKCLVHTNVTLVLELTACTTISERDPWKIEWKVWSVGWGRSVHSVKNVSALPIINSILTCTLLAINCMYESNRLVSLKKVANAKVNKSPGVSVFSLTDQDSTAAQKYTPPFCTDYLISYQCIVLTWSCFTLNGAFSVNQWSQIACERRLISKFG